MLRKEWFKFKKIRILLAWIGAPLLLIHSHLTPASFWAGTALMLLGEFIRLWALGYIERKGKQLTISGPYAYCRNPLYVGNFFLGLGVVVISSNVIIFFIFLIGFAILYRGTIRHEQTELRERFGKVYDDYRQNVPGIFPRLTPYAVPEKAAFQWANLVKHHEYVTVIALPLILCGIHLYDTLILQKQSLASQTGLLIVAAALTILLALERLFVSNFAQMFAQGFPNLFPKK